MASKVNPEQPSTPPSSPAPSATSQRRRSSLLNRKSSVHEALKALDELSLASTIDAPVRITLINHTIHTTLEALLTGLPSIGAGVVSIKFVLFVRDQGEDGVLSMNLHSWVALFNIFMVQLSALILSYHNSDAFRRKFLQMCLSPCFLVALNFLIFDGKPVGWAVPLVTLSYALSMTATYDFLPKETRGSRIVDFIENLVLSLCLYALPVFFVGINLLPTRLLIKLGNDYLTAFVVGVAYPFIGVLFKKFILGQVLSHLEMKVADGEVESLDKQFSTITKSCCSGLLMTPIVMQFLNTDVRFALLSAFLSLLVEVFGKSYTLYAESRISFYLNKFKGDDDDKKDKDAAIMAKASEEKKRRIRLLAIRYNGEIVAEKTCIIGAVMVATLTFQTEGGASLTDYITIGVVFFLFEIVTDALFVKITDRFVDRASEAAERPFSNTP